MPTAPAANNTNKVTSRRTTSPWKGGDTSTTAGRALGAATPSRVHCRAMSRRAPWLALPAVLVFSFSAGGCLRPETPPVVASRPNPGGKPLEQLQREFVDLRFGMFLHFGILTYTGSWSKPNLDIKQFNPVGLDPGQWADAAVAAKMKYAVLTTRHHDGFALWPSKASDFNVGHVPW